jgi:hypothetical protein
MTTTYRGAADRPSSAAKTQTINKPSTAMASATYESEEERSLLFSDSEQESISHADDNYTNDDDDQDNSMQWEDFMVRYWTSNNNSEDEEFQITAQADKIVMMENTDMVPHPLEPELDNSCDEFQTKKLDFDTTNNNNDTLEIFSEVGLQGTLQMAKLHAAANDHHAHQPTNKSTTTAAGGSTKKELLQKKKQLQEEFTIDMTHIPPIPKKKKKRSKGTTAATSGGIGMKMQQLQINPDGAARNNNYHQSPRQEQQQETLEDSLFAMAQRLSPGNNDNLSQQQQQQQHRRHNSITSDDVRSTKSSVQSVTSSSFSNNTNNNNSNNYSPLPNPNLIHQMGPIQTRTSLRSLLMKKWHPSWWMHYDAHSLLIFRSKDHLDDWVQNPYHGKRERAYLVKLRVDFGDIIVGGSGGGNLANNNSQNQQGSNNSGDANNNNNTNKDGSRILGHRILPVKKKSYHKNEPEMYQFKLERWTNMGVSVLAAFASEEEEDVQVLYDTIVEIMSTCPHGGLHNIDHMLQH